MRKVIITNASSVRDAGELSGPTVAKYWRLPMDYVLLDLGQMNDAYVTGKMNEELRAALLAAEMEERVLLSPLYSKFKSRSEALMLLVPSASAIYYFIGADKGRLGWPYLGLSPHWETSSTIRITGKLGTLSDKTTRCLTHVFGEWSVVMAEAEGLVEKQALSFAKEYFNATYEVRDSCGDATMALFMLLSKTKALTSLDSVGFFLPEDFNSPFLEIGGAGRKSQRS